jgi:uncharacterized SAM-binding protein YcdF (DUF218 family)
MKLNKSRLLIVISIIVLTTSILLFSVRLAGYWLLNSDNPQEADAIVVLAGNPTRAFYAADLYVKGYAPKIYISKPIRLHHERLLDELGVISPYAEDIYRQVLLKKGVPDSHIQVFGKSSISTVEEAEAIKELFKGSNKRLLVITSPYHTRRTKMIIRDVLGGYDVKVVATPYEPFPKKWWTDQDSARNVILEAFKILFYKLGGTFIPGRIEIMGLWLQRKS